MLFLSIKVNEGDYVQLYNKGIKVALARVESMRVGEVFHFQVIKEGFAKVLIVEAVQQEASLPFPTMGAETVGEAIGSYALWAISEMTPRLETTGVIEKDNFHVQNATKSTMHGVLRNRKEWVGMQVLLLHKCGDGIDVIATAIISLVLTSDVVGDEMLGEDTIGVFVCMVNIECNKCCTKMLRDHIYRWPIKHIQNHDGCSLVQERLLTHTSCTPEEVFGCMDERFLVTSSDKDVGPVTSKGAFYSQHFDVAENDRTSKTQKDLCTMNNVLHVSTIDCCKARCCQVTHRTEIYSSRVNYWGQRHGDRLTFVWDSMATSPGGSKKMMYNGREICEKAWWKIHGISRASFYRYKSLWRSGAIKGMHGNQGNHREYAHVVAAKEAIWQFVKCTADQMPHRCRTTNEGIRDTQYVLPSVYKLKDIQEEINGQLQTSNGRGISQPTFSRLWNKEFKEVQIATNNGFTKCDICTSIKEKMQSTKVESERLKYMQERERHMKMQRSCRSVYYSNRLLSCVKPEEYLCIIHDKMDQKKTCIPRLFPEPKATSQSYVLPVSLTGMLTHGHGPRTFGHFGLGLWKSDPNFTIGSLAKCLRDLETFDETNEANQHRHQLDTHDNIFSALLCTKASSNVLNLIGKHQDRSSIEDTTGTTTPMNTSSIKTLPRKLFLQMDNCGKDNKNRWVFSFLSLLVAKGIFEEVQLNFMMVGHTHEDIDALFGHYSENLRKQSIYTLSQLMDVFDGCSQKSRPLSYLIQEVPDFKTFVEGYIPEGANELVGHSKPLQFRFSNVGNYPMMHYKMHPRDQDWKPENGIEMWERGDDGTPKLPIGEPKVVPIMTHIKDVDLVVQGLKRFRDYWTRGKESVKEGSTFYNNIQPVIQYWESVIEKLQTSNRPYEQLKWGFWPTTRLTQSLVNGDNEMQSENIDDNQELHYCGPRAARPREEFKPHMDIEFGMFMLIRPFDESECPIWLGSAASPIVSNVNDEHNMQVLVDWWQPVSRKRRPTLKEQYKDCWTKSWKRNLDDPSRWESVYSVLWSWKTNKSAVDMATLKIPQIAINAARQNLQLKA